MKSGRLKKAGRASSQGCVVAILVMVLGYSIGFVLSNNAIRSDAQKAPLVHAIPAPLTPPIVYLVERTSGPHPELNITLSLSGFPKNTPIRFQMPTWCPGDYHLQNFAQYVHEVHTSEGRPVQRIDANTWEVETGDASSFSLTYSVSPSPAGFFTQNVCLAEDWAFINGSAAFLYVAGHRNDPISLQVKAPTSWDIASPLNPANSKDTFTAPDYDTLVDSPLVLGKMSRYPFEIAGVSHEIIAFRHPDQLDSSAFAEQLKPLLTTEIRLFGKVPPYKRYLFFVDAGGGGGGLEHVNSCRLGYHTGMNVDALVKLSAHEFFHLWNIKRIRPESLTPIDYITPPKTNNLWFAEGVTEYYAQRSLLKAGVISSQSYLQDLHSELERYHTASGSRFTADESSQYVWEANNSRGYGGMSFYNRGYLIGLCLDLKIRSVTQGEKSLDDVMRLLNSPEKCEEGVSENGIRDAVNQIAGQNLTAFYHDLCRTTTPLPITDSLSSAGLTLEAKGNISRIPLANLDQRTLRRDWLDTP